MQTNVKTNKNFLNNIHYSLKHKYRKLFGNAIHL